MNEYGRQAGKQAGRQRKDTIPARRKEEKNRGRKMVFIFVVVVVG